MIIWPSYTPNAIWSDKILGLYSLSGKTSYRKFSWSIEAARFWFRLLQSLWNLTDTSAARLPRCLSNFRAIRSLWHPISRLRDFTRFGGKTSYRLVSKGSDWIGAHQTISHTVLHNHQAVCKSWTLQGLPSAFSPHHSFCFTNLARSYIKYHQ